MTPQLLTRGDRRDELSTIVVANNARPPVFVSAGSDDPVTNGLRVALTKAAIEHQGAQKR